MGDTKVTLAAFAKSAEFIALVEVLRVRKGGRQIHAHAIEVLKGQLSDEFEIGVPTLWGKYGLEWFRNGERSLVFLSKSLGTLGHLARMPVITRGTTTLAVSYADDPGYLAGLNPTFEDDRLIVDWGKLRPFLLENR